MVRCENAKYLIAIRLALRRALQIEKTAVPGRNLHTLVPERGSPSRNFVEVVEWRVVATKLRQKNCRTFDRFHGIKIFRWLYGHDYTGSLYKTGGGADRRTAADFKTMENEFAIFL